MKERSGYYWDVLAWRNSRRVRAMDRFMRAIYREVMDEIWVNGAVPNDVYVISNMTGWPLEDVTAAWPQIRDCLKPLKKQPDFFTSERLERERKNRDEYYRSKREAGREGGLRSGVSRRQRVVSIKDTGEAKRSSASVVLPKQTKQNEPIPSTSSRSSSRNIGKTDPPNDLSITDDMREWGIANGFSEHELQRETPAMLDYFRGKGERKTDWMATWRNWMRNSRKFGGTHGTDSRNGSSNARAAQAGLGFGARPYTPKQ